MPLQRARNWMNTARYYHFLENYSQSCLIVNVDGGKWDFYKIKNYFPILLLFQKNEVQKNKWSSFVFQKKMKLNFIFLEYGTSKKWSLKMKVKMKFIPALLEGNLIWCFLLLPLISLLCQIFWLCRAATWGHDMNINNNKTRHKTSSNNNNY